MQSSQKKKRNFIMCLAALMSLGLLAVGSNAVLHAADDSAEKPENAQNQNAADAPTAAGERTPAGDTAPSGAAAPAENGECCQPGDTTPPLDLVKKIPPGGLHSPYPDYAKLAKDEELVKQFRLPGCNECHGGTGGGGFCPALSQGVWFWGNTDDVLFRLISLGSADLEKQGFTRIQWGTVHAGMPMMGHTIKTADHLWKIIAFIRSINPPGSNPPEKLVAPKMSAGGGTTNP
jgi:mono/diheme cytochrome c family protein